MLLRMAPIFTSGMIAGRYLVMNIFEVHQFASISPRVVFISEKPIHEVVFRGHTDVLLMLIAWGATGNERTNDGSVFVLLFLQIFVL